jgi:hypothetical protein
MLDKPISRIALHLHGVGGAGNGSPIEIGNLAYIDGGNVSSFYTGEHAARFRFDYPESCSSCAIDMYFADGRIPASFSYTVKSVTSGPLFVFARVSPYSVVDNISIVSKCGRSDFRRVSVAASDLLISGNPDWIWMRLEWLPTDSGVQDMTFLLYGQGYALDALVVSSTDLFANQDVALATMYADPSGRFIVLDDNVSNPLRRSTVIDSFVSSYSTLHLKILSIDAFGNVVGEFPTVSTSCDISGYSEDGWVNFDLVTMPAFSEADIPSRFGVGITQSPVSASRYFVWDEDGSSASAAVSKTIIYDRDGSSELESRLAIRVFARDDDSSDCIDTAPAERATFTIDQFSKPELRPEFNNTLSTTDGLALSLPERTLALVIDQSGSTSWSDQDGLRHKIPDNLLGALENAYPGRINSVISTFKGERIKVDWFAATESQLSFPANPSVAKSESFLDIGTDFSGVQVVRRYDRYPTSPTDGEIVAIGLVDRHVCSPPTSSVTTYYGIYPYDSYGVFGEARYIAIPSFGGQPAGIKSLSGREVIGTGERRSADALLLLHIDEGYGTFLHDFSDSSNHADVNYASAEPIWTGGTDGPPSSGGGGAKGPAIRLNGRNQWISTRGSVGVSQGVVRIAAWVYGFAGSSDRTVFSCYINNQLFTLTWDGSDLTSSWSGYSSSLPMPSGMWMRVCVEIDGNFGEMRIYSGDQSSKISIDSVASMSVGTLHIGHNPYGSGGYWFGRIAQVSVHGSAISHQEHLGRSSGVSADNGDRAIVLRWFVNPAVVGEDGYAHVVIKRSKEHGHLRVLNEDIAGPANIGGYAAPVEWRPPGTSPDSQPTSDLRVRLAMGDDIGPCTADQGDTIFDDNIQVGEHEIFLVEDFDSPFTTGSFGQRQRLTWECMRHFFRIFAAPSFNGKDFSPPDDSGLFEYTPRIVLPEDRPAVSLPPVESIEYKSSVSKVILNWVTPVSPDVSTVVVYYGKNNFANVEGDPLPDEGINTSYGAYPIFVGDKNAGSCVLRAGRIAVAENPGSSVNDITQGLSLGDVILDDLEPGKKAYFSLYTRDRFGNLSQPARVVVDIPDKEVPVGAGPEAVIALRYERVSNSTFAVRWFNPLLPRRFFDVRPWFDEKVYLYFKVSDEYGDPLPDQNQFNVQTEYVVSSSDAGASSLPGFCFVDGSYAFDATLRRAVVELYKFNDMVKIDRIDLLGGWKRFDISITSNSPERLACLEAVYFAAKASVTVRQTAIENTDADTGSNTSEYIDRSFSFVTQPIRIAFSNPLQVELITNDADRAVYPCDRIALQSNSGVSRICENSTPENPSILITGAYAGRSLPLTYKVLAKYRNQPLPEGSFVSISSFEDDLPTFSTSTFGGLVEETCGPVSSYKFKGLAEQIDIPKQYLWQFVANAREDIESAVYTDSVLIRPNSQVVSFTDSSDTSYAGCLYNSTCSLRASQAIFNISVPDVPAAAHVAATVSINGLRRTAHVYTAIAPTLWVDADINPPISDGRDIARQVARIYEIDADASLGGEVVSRPIPDGTPVRWELIGFRNSRERPFFSSASIDDPRYSFGVWDFTINGVSDRVFFGPASDVTTSLVTQISDSSSAGQGGNNIDGGGGSYTDTFVVPEEYVVRVTVYIGGQRASAQYPACLVPFVSQSFLQGNDGYNRELARKAAVYADAPISNISYPNTQVIYADGEDLALFRVVKDVRILDDFDKNINTYSFIKCYIDDGSGVGAIPESTYTPLSGGENVKLLVERPGDLRWQERGIYKPWWTWPVSIVIDGQRYFDTTSNADFVSLSLNSDNQRYFHVATNGFIPLKWSRFGEPTVWRTEDSDLVCDSFSIDGWTSWPSGNPDLPSSWIDYDLALGLEATQNIDGVNRQVVSRGDRGLGNPEKLIKLKEPLSVQFAYLERDGDRVSSGQLMADGQSAYSVVFAVTFSNKPVPDGTQVFISSCGSDVVGVANRVLQTQTVSETGSWYDPDAAGLTPNISSVVKVPLLPIQPGPGFETTVFAECNYDKSGSVFRQRVHGVCIKYTGSSFASVQGGLAGDDSGTSSGDSAGGGSVVPPADPPIIDGEYALDDASSDLSVPLSSACFVRDLNMASSPWVRTADMGFRKAWHGAASVAGKFLSFGGLTPSGVTNYCEMWDQVTNRWVPRAKMPIPIMGMIVVSDDRYVYSIGGVEFTGSVSGTSSGASCSSRVFRYDSVGDDWVELDSLPRRTSSPNAPSPGGFGSQFAGTPVIRHRVALGQAFVKNNHIFVFGGASELSSTTLEPVKVSNYVHVFDMSALGWVGSFELEDHDVGRIGRMHASVVDVEESVVAVVAGSGLYQENVDYSFGNSETIVSVPETRKYYYASSSLIDVSNFLNGDSDSPFQVYDGDHVFPDHPYPRDRHITLSYNNNVYMVGGSLPPLGSKLGTPATKKCDKLYLDEDGFYSYQSDTPLPMGRSIMASSVDGNGLALVSGGITTGHAPGFCQLVVEAYGEQTEANVQHTRDVVLLEDVSATARLDGRSGVDLRVLVYDDEGDLLTDDVTVELQGYIKFQGSSDEELSTSVGGFRMQGGRRGNVFRRRRRTGTKVYPVRIDPRRVDVHSGVGYARLAPRSEDPLRPISEIASLLNVADLGDLGLNSGVSDFSSDSLLSDIVIRQGKTRFPYQIIIGGSILDNFYFGSTSFNPDSESVSQQSLSESDSDLPLEEAEFAGNDVADGGDFANAARLPGFSLRQLRGISMPSGTTQIPSQNGDGEVKSYSYCATAIGTITGEGDTDLYSFVSPITGLIGFTVSARGGGDLKPFVRIFDKDFNPVRWESWSGQTVVGGSNNNSIFYMGFDQDGVVRSWIDLNSGRFLGVGNPDFQVVAGDKYYVQVSSWPTSDLPEYRNEYYNSNGNLVVQNYIHPPQHRLGEYRLIVGFKLDNIPSETLYGSPRSSYPLPCDGQINYESLEICWEQMVPISFFGQNGLEAPVQGREFIDGCEMAPHTVCVRPCMLSLTDGKSVVGAASGDPNWKLLTLPPYPCGQVADMPRTGIGCETAWPSTDCSKTIGEYLPDFCSVYAGGENFLKWAYAPWSPLWMCKSDLCEKCPNLCSLKNWPDFTTLPCLSSCQNPIRCSPNADDRRVDFVCSDRFWTTYLGFDISTRTVWGQLAFGADGQRVPVELNAAYPNYDPAAFEAAYSDPSIANFSHYLMPSVTPRLRRNFRFKIPCLSGQTFEIGALTDGQQDNSQGFNGGVGGCPFVCPACVRDVSSVYSGLRCSGSDNTTCTVLNVYSAPVDSNLASSGSGGESGQGESSFADSGELDGFIYLPPPLAAQISQDALQFELIMVPSTLFYGQYGANPISLPDSPIIQYYADMDWVPSVRTIYFEGDSALTSARSYINSLSKSVAFGCSPVYDSISQAVRTASSITDSMGSIVCIVLGDAEENLSNINSVELADDVNSVRGYRETPIYFVNIANAYPVTASAQATLADQGDQMYVANETAGSSYSVTDSGSVSAVARAVINIARGLASGSYMCTINFGQEVDITSLHISASDGSVASALLSISNDGRVFKETEAISSPSLPWYGSIRGVVFKLEIVLAQKFPPTGDDLVEAIVNSVSISYSKPSETLIVSKPRYLPAQPHQVVGVVDADIGKDSDVSFSAASHTYTSWNAFRSPLIPPAHGGGRVIVPIRSLDSNNNFRDIMIRRSRFAFASKIGPWQRGSAVVVKVDGAAVDDSLYQAYPDSGTVVFRNPILSNDVSIEVYGANKSVFAFNITNRSADSSVCINSLVVDTLEAPYPKPDQNSPPDVIDLRFIDMSVNRYSKIAISYFFVDADGDSEDVSKTEIKWYKNGVEQPLLANHRSFNDLNDPMDPLYVGQFWSRNYYSLAVAEGRPAEILAAQSDEKFIDQGDQLFFEIKPHDGKTFGRVRRGPTLVVVAPPDRPEGLNLIPKLISTRDDTLTLSNLSFAFADIEFFNPQNMLLSSIQWKYSPAGSSDEIDVGAPRPLRRDGDFGGSANSLEFYPQELVTLSSGQPIIGFPIGSRIYADLILPDNVRIRSNSLVVANTPPKVSLIRFFGQGDIASGVFQIIVSVVVEDVDVTLRQPGQTISYTARFEKRLGSGDFVPMVPTPSRSPDGRYVLISYPDGSGDIDCTESFTIRVSVTPYDGIQNGAVFTAEYSHAGNCTDFGI